MLAGAGALVAVDLLARPLRALAFPQAAGGNTPAQPKPPEVEQRITQIIAVHLGLDPKQVVPSARFIQDLGADSLDVVELTMAMEMSFDLDISDEECGQWKTVGDLTRAIQADVAKKKPASPPH
jgi:acyl carrier protein